MAKEYKVDIFKLMHSISNGDMDIIDSYSEDELKTISPYVISMWMKGADNNVDLRSILMNDYLNKYMFSLGNHKKLLFKLLCISNNIDPNTRYSFKNKLKKTASKLTKLVAQFHNCSDKHADDIINFLTEDDVIDIASRLGHDKKEVKVYINEYKKVKNL